AGEVARVLARLRELGGLLLGPAEQRRADARADEQDRDRGAERAGAEHRRAAGLLTDRAHGRGRYRANRRRRPTATRPGETCCGRVMLLPRKATAALALALLGLLVAAPAWSALSPPPARSFSVPVTPGKPVEPG